MNFAMTTRSVVSLGVLGLLLTTNGQAKDDPESGCTRKILSSMASPDNAWTVVVNEDICGRGPSFTTVILERVRLVPRGGERHRDGEILVLDEGSNPASHPLPRWLSSQEIQITIPNNSIITLKMTKCRHVEVKLKFNPDDPYTTRKIS